MPVPEEALSSDACSRASAACPGRLSWSARACPASWTCWRSSARRCRPCCPRWRARWGTAHGQGSWQGACVYLRLPSGIMRQVHSQPPYAHSRGFCCISQRCLAVLCPCLWGASVCDSRHSACLPLAAPTQQKLCLHLCCWRGSVLVELFACAGCRKGWGWGGKAKQGHAWQARPMVPCCLCVLQWRRRLDGPFFGVFARTLGARQARSCEVFEDNTPSLPVQVTVKPGYSWRVGVHPPDGYDLQTMGPLERHVRSRSTQPALMQVGETERKAHDWEKERRVRWVLGDSRGGRMGSLRCMVPAMGMRQLAGRLPKV